METKQTLYCTYVAAQKGNAERIALYTRDGEGITHGRLLDEIDRVAEGLLTYKSSDDFKVGIISSSSYEEAVFLLAVNKIGAVSKYIDFTKNITEIGESISESSINVLVMGAEFLPMEPLVNPKGLPVIILGETKENNSHYHTYQELLNASDSVSLSPAEYQENKCAVIINSSGTTGTPKPIELSDYAINSAVIKLSKTDYPLDEKNLLLKTIPSHIGMGLITSLYTSLIIGIPMIYLGGNSPKESIELTIGLMSNYKQFLVMHNLNNATKLLIFGAPMYYRSIFQFIDNLSDLSYLGCMLAGGSAMSKEELETMDSVFSSKGCLVPILNGYGQNEMAGAVTLNQISNNKRGSAGVVVSETDIRIVDLITSSELPRNQIGKILERSDSLFLQYENMPEATKAAFIYDNDNTKWFDTNDLGYIDDDGFLFITGRTSRVIIRFDCKISLDVIENKIRASKYVKEIGVIAVKSKGDEIIIGFAILKDEYSRLSSCPISIIDDVQSSRNPLNDLEKVNKLIIVDSMPYLSNGKIDYRALEKQAEEMIKA